MASKNITDIVASYISKSQDTAIPEDVIEKAKHHILDSLAAILSGSALEAGRLAIKNAESKGSIDEAQVAGSGKLTSAVDAAMANAIMAHADETDDSHAPSLTHPGCAVIPAALAVSEKARVNGTAFLKGVAAGYDVGCRITSALGVEALRSRYRSTHSIGSNFGAAAAAASVLRLQEEGVRYALSFISQQASGLTYWIQGDARVEKAFVFAGMPARNGVTAATLVQSGFTAVLDPFCGEKNFFDAFSPAPDPALFSEGLGSYYAIAHTNIKKFPVGSPVQAPIQAVLNLIETKGLRAGDVGHILVHISSEGLKTVDNARLPDINLQYLIAITLIDRGFSFDAAHSHERMSEKDVLAMRKRITLTEDPELSASENKRQAIVEVTT
ncbi:MAG: MmgE/PrpD family protein, partial [Deltaproteobacteria bacterium]|nr:MmgE/PrpD family protein [Deltaproteobacteria bacterium]